MAISRWRSAVLPAAVVLSALVVASCGTAARSAIRAAQHADAGSGATATTSAKPTPSKPARPRLIDLKNVDPCQLLTPQQRQQLNLDRPPIGSKVAPYNNAGGCSIRDDAHNMAAQVIVAPAMGIEYFTTDNSNVTTQPITVSGFPAIVVRTVGQTDFCNVMVDVADGQFLGALANDHSSPPHPLDELCQKAQNVAEAAMTSLKGSH